MTREGRKSSPICKRKEEGKWTKIWNLCVDGMDEYYQIGEGKEERKEESKRKRKNLKRVMVRDGICGE